MYRACLQLYIACHIPVYSTSPPQKPFSKSSFQSSKLYIISRFYKKKYRNKPDYRFSTLEIASISQRFQEIEQKRSTRPLFIFYGLLSHPRPLRETRTASIQIWMMEMTSHLSSPLKPSLSDQGSRATRRYAVPRGMKMSPMITLIKFIGEIKRPTFTSKLTNCSEQLMILKI